MDLRKLPHQIYTPPLARPLFLSGGETAVILFHGWTGYPGELHYLGYRLHDAGFTVSIPRLPGHGTCGEDLLQTSRHDWLRHSVDHFLDLKNSFAEVYLVGFSMGGLIATILAAQFRVNKLVLIAPAFEAATRFLCLTPLVQIFLPRIKLRYEEESDDPDLHYIAREYRSWSWIKPAAELYRLQKTANRYLKFVYSSLFTIASRGDRTVPVRVAELVEAQAPSRDKAQLILSNSGHKMVDGEEKELISEEIEKWLKYHS
jgi:carboxylesterase